MNINLISEKVQKLLSHVDKEVFIYDFLECYGKPKSILARLKVKGQGTFNLAKNEREVIWKKQLYFIQTDSENLLSIIDNAKKKPEIIKQEPRFIIVTNFKNLLAIDTKRGDTLDINFEDIPSKYDFFLPWAGLEKTEIFNERDADVKAAEKMAKLFDLLRHRNPVETLEEIHFQNVFLSRILFCYFAEDTGIFSPNLFTQNVSKFTADNGEDLDEYLSQIFAVMDLEKRGELPKHLNFPYVNGGLFADKLPVPKFDRKSRAMLIECGAELNWSEINPDIFGSMIQAVVNPKQRGNMGMHYTNVPNIMKVIEPLFLTELKEEFRKNFDSQQRLELLLLRLEHIKVFDPACGSGNFLIIAYKELRKLEMDIYKQLMKLSKEGLFPLSRIKLTQFYGIELDDFAHEVAILSLWLAEHQQNMKFKTTFGHSDPALPLKSGGNVIQGNALRRKWQDLVNCDENSELYILGNPPYLGYSLQDKEQKEDIEIVFSGLDNIKSLDYIACWFYKAALILKPLKGKAAFVSTNSICQGEQVGLLWPLILNNEIEINFCHTSFKWENQAKNNAAVFCVIVGIAKASNVLKLHISDGFERKVENINPYLIPTKKNIILPKRRTPISKVPAMNRGSSPVDGGFLLLTPEEKNILVQSSPSAVKFLRLIMGAREFTDGLERWCLWIKDSELGEALKDPLIKYRLEQVAKFRQDSPKKGTQELGQVPHRFGEIRIQEENFILVPRHGSDKREYLPLGFVDGNVIPSDAAQAIYTNDVVIFGILSSTIHLVWIKTSCGKIKEDPRYSPQLGYNNYPFPNLTKTSRERISCAAMDLIAERENFSHMTISEMYNPISMPSSLKEKHNDLDDAVEWAYIGRKFKSDDERLEYLFKQYEKMMGSENA